jgi:HEPN domain-containing protein
LIDLNFVNSLKKDFVSEVYKSEKEDIFLVVGEFHGDKSKRREGFNIPNYARVVFLTEQEFSDLPKIQLDTHRLQRLYSRDESLKLSAIIQKSTNKPDKRFLDYSEAIIKKKINSEMMQMSLSEVVTQDLRASKVLFESGLFGHASFFLCQAIEKALKSLIIKMGIIVPKIHSLKGLLSYISEKKGFDLKEDVANLAQKCDKIYLLSRYPPVVFGEKTGRTVDINKSDVQECITLLIFIKEIVQDRFSVD